MTFSFLEISSKKNYMGTEYINRQTVVYGYIQFPYNFFLKKFLEMRMPFFGVFSVYPEKTTFSLLNIPSKKKILGTEYINRQTVVYGYIQFPSNFFLKKFLEMRMLFFGVFSVYPEKTTFSLLDIPSKKNLGTEYINRQTVVYGYIQFPYNFFLKKFLEMRMLFFGVFSVYPEKTTFSLLNIPSKKNLGTEYIDRQKVVYGYI